MTTPLRVGLFAPCFVDRLVPQTAWAAWHVLRAFGVEVVVEPDAPPCCGQPLSSMGQPDRSCDIPGAYARAHAGCDVVVNLSASCTAHVRHRHAQLARPVDRPSVERSPVTRTFSEFLWNDLGLRAIPGTFPHRVGLHPGCHGLRDLGLATPSEAVHTAQTDIAGSLLSSIDGLIRVHPTRADECCGFGGSFAVRESHVSGRMGRDRLAQFSGVEVLTSTDPSCLLHLARHRLGPRPRILPLPDLIAEAMGLHVGAHS